WFTAGSPVQPGERGWIDWTFGEAQRATPLVQTTARISRVEVPAGDGTPPGRYALRFDYTGDAAIYSGLQRYLPGDAYRIGFWVKGDGSKSRLSALFLDYTNGADAFEGGWKRIHDGERDVATLDFTGWRYVEVDLPGRGIGTNLPNGSTQNVDFPLELTAFRIQTPSPGAGAPASGSVLVGPIQVFTQLALSNTLSVLIGYDDPENHWQPALGADVTVQNSALATSRKVKANWSLLDRANEPIATGQTDLDLPAGGAGTFRLDLAAHAKEIEGRAAPLRLKVVAYDSADASVSTTRQLILTHPDSHALVTDFEADRGYLGLQAREIKPSLQPGETVARTSTEQAHSGQRSLLIAWDRDNLPRQFISVDPALPGIPVELSLWVYGDGSGVLFYPVIGDRKGINKGLPNTQWNLFLPRTEGPLQNAVRVDWTGWRELKFHLPLPAPNWAETMPTLGFVPNYPLGVHLAVDATGVANATGKLFVDDISVTTHLQPRERMELALVCPGESNIQLPGTPVQVTVANDDLVVSRHVSLSGGLFDWRGNRVLGVDTELDLAPGSQKKIELVKNVPSGFYRIKATLSEAGKAGAVPLILAALEQDVLVVDPVATLGADWAHAITDEWALRKPIKDRFAFVDEDWDWVESYPGNLQIDTIRQRARRITAAGGEPYMLLGYSAYWAAGIGYEALNAGAFLRAPRDRGHAVNTFLIPKRIEDWDDYVCELMRGAGQDVSGWVVWDAPDSNGPMGFAPEKFAAFLQSVDKWRRTYCPSKPLLVGGMGRETAVPYLQELAKHDGLDAITGVNVRLDVGQLSPEDAGVVGYSRELRAALNPVSTSSPKSILFTNLDWAVEKGGTGLDAFDQAAYLARSALLLNREGIQSSLAIRNEDFVRLGLGLTYRRELLIPPVKEKPLAFQFKPGWWAMARVRQWLDDSPVNGEVEVQDVVPGRTRCLLEKAKEGQAVAAIWRNDDVGQVSFSKTGLSVVLAEDLFGAPIPVADGWYSVGKVPCRFILAENGEPAAQALGRIWIRDGAESLWPQRVLAAFTPDSGKRQNYEHTGGEATRLPGRTATGETLDLPGMRFAANGSERFTVDAPAGASLVLRKTFLLDATGQEAEVFVNGKSAGKWDLRRSEKELSGGLRDAIFVVDNAALAGQPQAHIEIRYLTEANTADWRVMEWREGDFPLSAVGPLHADQNVGMPRFARNVVGSSLKIGTTAFANGIGTFARSLIEFPLNGQFRRFTAKVGVDAITEGRGSVVFEIYGDGKKLWSSTTLSGLDAQKEIDIDVTRINRLRLVVTDAGDGNKFDVADWCDPVL
ncbi:MAG: NPCBM/NEW2 domain-containing protein, partial [Chthoniobacteraceae bacterium]